MNNYDRLASITPHSSSADLAVITTLLLGSEVIGMEHMEAGMEETSMSFLRAIHLLPRVLGSAILAEQEHIMESKPETVEEYLVNARLRDLIVKAFAPEQQVRSEDTGTEYLTGLVHRVALTSFMIGLGWEASLPFEVKQSEEVDDSGQTHLVTWLEDRRHTVEPPVEVEPGPPELTEPLDPSEFPD